MKGWTPISGRQANNRQHATSNKCRCKSSAPGLAHCLSVEYGWRISQLVQEKEWRPPTKRGGGETQGDELVKMDRRSACRATHHSAVARRIWRSLCLAWQVWPAVSTAHTTGTANMAESEENPLPCSAGTPGRWLSAHSGPALEEASNKEPSARSAGVTGRRELHRWKPLDDKPQTPHKLLLVASLLLETAQIGPLGSEEDQNKPKKPKMTKNGAKPPCSPCSAGTTHLP